MNNKTINEIINDLTIISECMPEETNYFETIINTIKKGKTHQAAMQIGFLIGIIGDRDSNINLTNIAYKLDANNLDEN